VSGDHVLAVRGSKVNPITHGAICAKVANSYPEFVHGPNRLRYPLKRIGPKGEGNFERTSWEAGWTPFVIASDSHRALRPPGGAAAQLRRAAWNAGGRFHVAALFSRPGRLVAEPQPVVRRHPQRRVRWHLRATPGTPLQQVSLAKLIIVWGNNATVCNLHLMRQINAAKRNGAKLVVIDPGASRSPNRHTCICRSVLERMCAGVGDCCGAGETGRPRSRLHR